MQTLKRKSLKKNTPFTFFGRVKSFYYAWNGFRTFLKTEHNARIHLLATVFVGIAIFFIPVTKHEVILLLVVTGLVWAAELFNSAIEKIMDFISKEKSEEIKYIKDASAGAVLIISVLAVICACLIFIPKFL